MSEPRELEGVSVDMVAAFMLASLIVGVLIGRASKGVEYVETRPEPIAGILLPASE